MKEISYLHDPSFPKYFWFNEMVFFTGYYFWDLLRNFLHKYIWIILTVHKLNKLGKFWQIYGQLLNIMSSYGWYKKFRRSHDYYVNSNVNDLFKLEEISVFKNKSWLWLCRKSSLDTTPLNHLDWSVLCWYCTV